MNSSDWVLVITSLFLGATALFVPVLGEILKRTIFAPKLLASFQLAPPYCNKTVYRSPTDPTLQEPVYFFRFQITNSGRAQARLCEAVLEDLWIYDAAGNPIKLPNFSPVNLRWAESNTSFLDINPRRKVHCNIGHIPSASYQKKEESQLLIDVPGRHSDDLRFVLEQLVYPFSQPSCLVPGRYAIKVSLYSENAPREEIYFRLVWSGKWQDAESEMFRELVIHRVDGI